MKLFDVNSWRWQLASTGKIPSCTGLDDMTVNQVTSCTIMAKDWARWAEEAHHRVYRDAQDLGVEGGKLVVSIAESGDLGGAHKGEVEGVEEEDDVLLLLLVVREPDLENLHNHWKHDRSRDTVSTRF
jgi:hypothetical protein